MKHFSIYCVLCFLICACEPPENSYLFTKDQSVDAMLPSRTADLSPLEELQDLSDMNLLDINPPDAAIVHDANTIHDANIAHDAEILTHHDMMSEYMNDLLLPDLDILDANTDVDSWQADPNDYCQESDLFIPEFQYEITRWSTQYQSLEDQRTGIMMIGSSSVRRWENFYQTFRDYHPIQRGYGGVQLGEVAQQIPQILLQYNPQAILIFAGTNDLSVGVPNEIIFDRMRCVRQRIAEHLEWSTPILWVGVTPTPARWSQWESAQLFNQTVRSYANQDPYFYYIDTPALFLAERTAEAIDQQEPPPVNLYDEDQLHLSALGYDIWAREIRTQLETIIPIPPSPPIVPSLPENSMIRIDLGASAQVHGEHTATPDYLGFIWNNWHTIEGGLALLPGERLDDLQDITGRHTEVDFIITGGCKMLGWLDQGIRWPSQEDYGDLAVGSAMGDFCALDGSDYNGGFVIKDLNPQQAIRLRFSSGQVFTQNQRLGIKIYGGVASQLIAQDDISVSTPLSMITFDQIYANHRGELYIDLEQLGSERVGIAIIELTAL